MKKILLISYYFPPLGMGGTQRMASFARYLPQFGWQPVVLTVKPIRYYARDPELLKGLEKIRIYRTESMDPLRLAFRLAEKLPTARSQDEFATDGGKIGHLVLKWFNALILPDSKRLWHPFALRQARQILQQEPFHAVLSSGPPHSSHLLAQKIVAKFQLPWVADFRDGWADGDFQPQPTRLHRFLNRAMQKSVLTSANAVTAVSEGLLESLKRSVQKQPLKIVMLTNGFEAEDFRGRVEKDSCFDIVHVGTVGNFVQPQVFLKAYKYFVETAGLAPDEVKLWFVGRDLSGQLARQIREAGLAAYAELTGYLHHLLAVQHLRRADLLLYLVSGEAYPGFIPGKTFEYLAAGRPVLIIAPQIEGGRILQAHRPTRWLRPDNFDSMVMALRAFYTEFKKGHLHAAKAGDIAQYSRKALAQKLAQLLDEISPYAR